MFVPLLVLVGLLGAALAALTLRLARLRRDAEGAAARARTAEARTARALEALHRAEAVLDRPVGPEPRSAEAAPTDPRGDAPADRRPRRRTRRVGPPATPDRP